MIPVSISKIARFDCVPRYRSSLRSARKNQGVAVTPGVCVGVRVFVTVGVREGVAVLVDVRVRVGVGVFEDVAVGGAVGASPCKINCPTTFQSKPTKIATSYVPGSQSLAGASHST